MSIVKRLFQSVLFYCLFAGTGLALETGETATSQNKESDTICEANHSDIAQGRFKPPVNYYLASTEFLPMVSGRIVFWNLANPGLNSLEGEAVLADSRKRSGADISAVRAYMLEEFPAFLSGQGIYPNVYVFTGVSDPWIVESLKEVLSRISRDTYIKWSDTDQGFYHSNYWEDRWIQDFGLLIISRYGCAEGRVFAKSIEVEGVLETGLVRVGNAMVAEVKIDHSRTLNLLVYNNWIYNLEQMAEQLKTDIDKPDISRHPAVVGFEQALAWAREFFAGSSSPLLVASNLNIPLQPDESAELALHMRHLGIEMKQAEAENRGSFDISSNPLAKFWLDVRGGLDYLHKPSTAELVDMIGLFNPGGNASVDVAMQTVPFHAACPYTLQVTMPCGSGYKLFNDDIYQARQFACMRQNQADHEEGSSQKADYVINSPSGHHPIYAEVTFPDEKPVDVDGFCDEGVYEMFDFDAYNRKKGRIPDTLHVDGMVSQNFRKEEVDIILRAAAFQMPADSSVAVLCDVNGKVVGLPVKVGREKCGKSFFKSTGATPLGMVRKNAKGKLRLEKMDFEGRKNINNWKSIFLSGTTEYLKSLNNWRKSSSVEQTRLEIMGRWHHLFIRHF